MWPKAISMIANGDLPLDDIITHFLPLTEFKKGIDTVGQRLNIFYRLHNYLQVLTGKDNIKVMLKP